MREFLIYVRACAIVILLTTNTYLISEKLFLYAVLINGGIAFMWTINVKDLAVATWKDRLVYILGSVSGVYIALYHLSKLFKG